MRREIHSDFRLEVRPETRTLPASVLTNRDAMRRLLADMETAILRHVDDVASVTARWDTKAVCSFCSAEWETATAADLAESPDAFAGFVVGEPTCCGEGAAEFRAAQVPDTKAGA